MRLPRSSHASRPWRIHEIAPDFHLEDVWALPTPGRREDFPLLVDLVASSDVSRSGSAIVRTLFEIRWKLGAWFGWDDMDAGPSSWVSSLHGRLPHDLRSGPTGPAFGALPFTPLYLTDDEFAAEIANRTMHGIMHLGWVRDGDRGYRGQMAVLVKPNGVLGSAYMASIRPFRHILVYPAAIRRLARVWRDLVPASERNPLP